MEHTTCTGSRVLGTGEQVVGPRTDLGSLSRGQKVMAETRRMLWACCPTARLAHATWLCVVCNLSDE